MVYIAVLPAQASAEETFGNQTPENARVKAEDVEEYWTQKVISKDETTEVKSENSLNTEAQVCECVTGGYV